MPLRPIWRKIIGHENKQDRRVTMRYKVTKKVYCKDCEYFEKKDNPNYYMRPGGGTSSEKFTYKCLSPNNVKRVTGHFDTFEGPQPIHSWPSRPEWLNQGNKCPWYNEKIKEEPSWEK